MNLKYYKEVHREFLPSGEFRWISYYEFEESHVKRQIDVFPDTVLLLTGFECCEADLEDMEFGREDQVEPEVFHQLWVQYSATPHGTRRTDNPFIRAGFKGELPPSSTS